MEKNSVLPLSEVERKHILEALEAFGWRRSPTAQALGISVRTLRIKLAEYRKMGMVIPVWQREKAAESASFTTETVTR